MIEESEDQKSCLEAIGRYLIESVPEPWTEIDACAELLSHGLINVATFYRPERDPKLYEPFMIEDGATDFQFAQCFQRLARLVSTPEKGLFKKCSYHLKSNGAYSADYVY
jgi:hypothetical protein